MLTVKIDNDAIEARLRERAAANGHSPEDEARDVLGTALLSPPEAQAPKTEASARSLVDEIQDLFAPFGGPRFAYSAAQAFCAHLIGA